MYKPIKGESITFIGGGNNMGQFKPVSISLGAVGARNMFINMEMLSMSGTSGYGIQTKFPEGIEICRKQEWINKPTHPGWWAFTGQYNYSPEKIFEHIFEVYEEDGGLFVSWGCDHTPLTEFSGLWVELLPEWPEMPANVDLSGYTTKWHNEPQLTWCFYAFIGKHKETNLREVFYVYYNNKRVAGGISGEYDVSELEGQWLYLYIYWPSLFTKGEPTVKEWIDEPDQEGQWAFAGQADGEGYSRDIWKVMNTSAGLLASSRGRMCLVKRMVGKWMLIEIDWPEQ